MTIGIVFRKAVQYPGMDFLRNKILIQFIYF